MSAFLFKRGLPKVTKNHYYLYNKVLIRVVSVNVRENRVVLYRYDSFVKEAIELDTAPHYLTPLFKIGDVGKMLNRSVETIRKYENQKLIDKAKQYKVSSLPNGPSVRLYSETDIYALADFFAQRRSVGRPSTKNQVSKINRKELNEFINSRFQKVKRNG